MCFSNSSYALKCEVWLGIAAGAIATSGRIREGGGVDVAEAVAVHFVSVDFKRDIQQRRTSQLEVASGSGKVSINFMLRVVTYRLEEII